MAEWRYGDSHQAWQWEQKAHVGQKEGEVIYSLSLYPVMHFTIKAEPPKPPQTVPTSVCGGVQMTETMGHFSFKLPYVCTCVSVWGVEAQSQHWGPPQVLYFLSRGLSLAERGAHRLLE